MAKPPCSAAMIIKGYNLWNFMYVSLDRTALPLFVLVFCFTSTVNSNGHVETVS